MASYSYNANLGGSLNTENHLISPAILIPSSGNYLLSFYACCAHLGYPDTLMVKLAIGEDNYNFSTTIMPLTPMTSTTFQLYSIDLANFSGQTIRLAFIHKSYDGTYLLLDNISIENINTSYTINVQSSNSSIGTVTGGGTYNIGDTVMLNATANVGYRFTGWNDGLTDNPRTVIVTENTTYIAYFNDLGDSERHYDNEIYSNSVGNGNSIYWGIRFPAGSLSGYNYLEAVRIMDKYAGDYELRIYQGGNSAPETQLTTQVLQLTGSNNWFEASLNTPININHSEPLWIIFYNNGVAYPASGSTYAGNPDGSWISANGTSWVNICQYELYYTWMIHAVLGNESLPTQQYTITAISSNNIMGTVSGGGTFNVGANITLTASAASHHHFTNWHDGNQSNPRAVSVTEDATYIANFAIDKHEIIVNSAQPTMGNVSGGGTFDYGTEIQIVAIPYSNYEFTKWNDGNTNNPRQITITENKTYTAEFQSTIGIEELKQKEISVLSHDNEIIVSGAEGLLLELFDITGRKIAQDSRTELSRRVFSVNSSGVYLVRTNHGTTKKVSVY